ncbi:lytic transglycosylase domain-containing protein [Klebsiella sp. PL-2018]|uniref:lytic transglycosylase domain-containing protein n=1 Tax=Klebsiella TaxID=570 RepID=UPI001C79209D|nr:lytic transglycosylase domain-containing protein [Klebsiella sp. PL-2018]QXD00971.1 IncI1 plasmid conjugative transfer putative membrane protein PilT [Klebsiella sp. PL-2018]
MRGPRLFCLLMMLILASGAVRAAPSQPRPLSVNLDRCFQIAGQKYKISPQLLRAIGKRESSLRHWVTNDNRNTAGKIVSTDYGVMQINSIHIPRLIRLGVIRSAQDLLTRPCLNIQVGAWILAQHLQVCGLTWTCLGSYNAGFSKNNTPARQKYAGYIKDILRRESGL